MQTRESKRGVDTPQAIKMRPKTTKETIIALVKEKDGQSETLRVRRTQTPNSFQCPCPISVYQPARTLLPLLPFSRHLGHFHLEVCFTSYSSLSCSHQHGKFLKDSVAYSSICNTQGPRILCVRSVIILHLFLPLPYVSYGIS